MSSNTKVKKLRYTHLKSFPKRLRQGFFRFCIYGALLLAGEVGFYTLTKVGRTIPFLSFLFQYDWEVDPSLLLHHIWDVPIITFFGQASLYMFVVYGAICVLGLEPAYRFLKKKDVPTIIRGLIYMCIILFMECTLGWVLKFFTGYDIWIYYGMGTLFTYTSLAIAPMWFICGLISENVINIIDSFDEMKMNMYGLSDYQAENTSVKKNRIVVLSDIHIGQKNEDGSPVGWFYGVYEIYLTIILYKISMDKRVKELVFLGDLFDTWLYPPEEKPESISTIIEKWKDSLFIAPLLKCIEKCDAVYYIPGNHDMHVQERDVVSLQSGGKKLRVLSAQEYNNMTHLENGTALHMEHGNDADFFNAPDTDGDSVQGMPFGYFVSRLVSAAEDFNIDSIFRETYTKILVSHFTVKNDESEDHRAGKLFIALFVDALVVYANSKREAVNEINDHTVIRMPEGYTDVTIAEIKTKYSSLLSQWLKNHKTYLFAAAGKNGLNEYAQSKFGKKDTKLFFKRLFTRQKTELVVVMGHTHYSLKEYINDREVQGLYVNTGCMCKNSKQSLVRWIELIDSPRDCYVHLNRM